ncbi:MAG TPA: hypothetical protein EYQ24_17660, partial [Bacteroidetes bacterium]|nr:hypothetical protein [Bacteroidota bacterium]
KRGQPTSFPLNRVIKGWTEGLQLLAEGESARFWIPAGLAYGESPGGGRPATHAAQQPRPRGGGPPAAPRPGRAPRAVTLSPPAYRRPLRAGWT